MTTREQNMATCREFNQRVFNEHDVAFAEETVADAFVDLTPPPGTVGDKASAIALIRQMSEQRTDAKAETLDLVASANKVSVRTRITGTDTEGFMPGMPPTGKSYSLETVDVMTFDENGLITEHYGVADRAGVMIQLGLLPVPSADRPHP